MVTEAHQKKQNMEKSNIQLLPDETEAVLGFIKSEFDTKPLPPNFKVCQKFPREKCKAFSEQLRMEGDKIYLTGNFDERAYKKIWFLYTKSIALAPKDSEELALGYNKRSLLLYQLERFTECISNCDLALSSYVNDFTKIELLHRKALCLLAVGKCDEAERMSKEAREFLKECRTFYRNSKKQSYLKSFDKIERQSIIRESSGETKSAEAGKSRSYDIYREVDFENFHRHENIPCASESVDFKYDNEWGRHVVATKDIPAGEIIAIEKNFFVQMNLQGKYLSCSYCNQFSWVSFPCPDCVDDIYCSEKCQKKAWEQYHRYECKLYRNYVENEPHLETLYLRLYLKIMDKSGGFKTVIQDLVDIGSTCGKSLSKDEVFDELDIKSFFRMQSIPINNIDPKILYSVLHMSCRLVFLLAQETDFFTGKNEDSTCINGMIKDPEITFAIILFFRMLLLLPYNMNMFMDKLEDEFVYYGFHIGTFSSFFNHSCDPNVESFVSKNEETIIYATRPIKKGSQLFKCYFDKEKLSPLSDEQKTLRQSYLKDFYNFCCKCSACTNDWSTRTGVSILSLENSAYLLREFNNLTKTETLKNIIQSGEVPQDIAYDIILMRDIRLNLKWLAENFTIYCREYEIILKTLKKVTQDVFGSCMIEFSNKSS